MVQLKAFELFLQFAYFAIVRAHAWVTRLHCLHDLVDDQLGVPPHQESLGSHLGRDSKSVDEGLIFCHVVGRVEVEEDGISELVPLRGREDDPCVAANLELGSVEVHGPVFRVLDRGWCLRFCPLCDKVGQGLRFDRSSGDVAEVEHIEFERPLHDAPRSVAVADDFTEGVVDTTATGWRSK